VLKTSGCIIAFALSVSSALAAPGDIVNLGNLSGTRPSSARDINGAGDVVGVAEVPAAAPLTVVKRGFVWSSAGGGTIQDLGTLGGSSATEALGINSAGAVTGWSPPASGYERAFIRPSTGGPMQNLGVNTGSYSRAAAINDAGDVTGHLNYFDGTGPRAFLRRASDGATVELPQPAGATECVAYDLNGAGDVVGTVGRAGSSRGFLWRESTGAYFELGTLGGASSYAHGINEAADIVGMAQDAAGVFLPFGRRADDGGMDALELDGGATTGRAVGLNGSGTIVGSVQIPGTGNRAAAWTAAGDMINLDAWLDANNSTLGQFWTLTDAAAINASGMIAGTGTYNDGPGGLTDGTRAFVLETGNFVPEPALGAVLLPALLLGTRRRRPSSKSPAGRGY
jgi:uncharacterized membrane protein